MVDGVCALEGWLEIYGFSLGACRRICGDRLVGSSSVDVWAQGLDGRNELICSYPDLLAAVSRTYGENMGPSHCNPWIFW